MEPKIGQEVFSNAYIGPVEPVANNVTIIKSGMTLQGKYDYYHIHNFPENESSYTWSVDGVVVSTNISYVVNFNGTKTVVFTVTPKSAQAPTTGKPVSVAVTIEGNSSSHGLASGGSFGGGGGGSR